MVWKLVTKVSTSLQVLRGIGYFILHVSENIYKKQQHYLKPVMTEINVLPCRPTIWNVLMAFYNVVVNNFSPQSRQLVHGVCGWAPPERDRCSLHPAIQHGCRVREKWVHVAGQSRLYHCLTWDNCPHKQTGQCCLVCFKDKYNLHLLLLCVYLLMDKKSSTTILILNNHHTREMDALINVYW